VFHSVFLLGPDQYVRAVPLTDRVQRRRRLGRVLPVALTERRGRGGESLDNRIIRSEEQRLLLGGYDELPFPLGGYLIFID